MKYIIAAILGISVLSGTVYWLTTLADDSVTAEKAESVLSVTVSGKVGVKISDTLCATPTGAEICLN